MKKWFKLFIASVAIIGLVNGCVEPKTPEQMIASSADKKMMSAFVKNKSKLKGEYLSGNSYNINLRNNIETVPFSLNRHIGSYASKYDASRDTIARLYIKTAKSRGNKVKLYKTSVNSAMARLAPQGSYASISLKRYDLDPALIEFDKNGRIKSALVRRHYFPYLHNKSARAHDRDSIILIGETIRQIEMVVGNATLANGYITTL